MRLNKLDKELTNKINDAKSTQLAEKILIAPDYVYAACLMRGEGVFFGKGDFQKLVDLLKLSKNKNYKDIGSKLAMVKTGRLFKKGILPDLNDANSQGITDNIQCQEIDYVNVYQDSKRTYQEHSVNSKNVFGIW